MSDANQNSTNSRISISEDKLDSKLYAMELRLVREMGDLKDMIPTDDRIKEIIRSEGQIETQDMWKVRSLMAAVGMFFVAVSTFLFTLFQGNPPTS